MERELDGLVRRRVLPASGMSGFVQGLWQAATGSREEYRPDDRVTVDVGSRYEATDRVGLMLQMNALWQNRDSGAPAEPADCGGTFVYLSPGVSCEVAKSAQIYAFVQKPLYQYVNGVQLTADWSAIVGLTIRFCPERSMQTGDVCCAWSAIRPPPTSTSGRLLRAPKLSRGS